MRIRKISAVASLVVLFALAALAGAGDAVPGWNPASFRDDSVLEIMTTEPELGEHWSKLWLVVIDDQLYVRLGDRAYGRVQKNTTKPYVKLKVGGQEYDKVKLDETPDMKEKVAAAMADKYFMDKLIRYENHPMAARLTPEPGPPSAAP